MPGLSRAVRFGSGWTRPVPGPGRCFACHPDAPGRRPRIGVRRRQALAAPRPDWVAPGFLARSRRPPRLASRPFAAPHRRGRSGCSARRSRRPRGGGSPPWSNRFGHPAGFRRQPESGRFRGCPHHRSRESRSPTTGPPCCPCLRLAADPRSGAGLRSRTGARSGEPLRSRTGARSGEPPRSRTGARSGEPLPSPTAVRSGAGRRRVGSAGRAARCHCSRRAGPSRRDRRSVPARPGRMAGPGRGLWIHLSRPASGSASRSSRPGRSRR